MAMDTAISPWRAALEGVWSEQHRWSEHASALKRGQKSFTGPLTFLALTGTVLSTLSPYIVAHIASSTTSRSLVVVITLLGPAFAALSTFLVASLLSPKSERAWIDARQLSEALKAEGYMFATGAPPYSDATKAPQLLVDKLTELTRDTKELGIPRDIAPQGHPHPMEPLDPAGYLAKRVAAQITYHRQEARKFDTKLRRWRFAAIALGSVSAVLGLVAGLGNLVSLNVWVAVVSAALATLTTYVYANQFELLAAMFFNTAERLDRLRLRWAVSAQSAEEWQRFVLDCEALLAAQNRNWSETLTKQASDKLQRTQPTG
jgi:hypothetical protein